MVTWLLYNVFTHYIYLLYRIGNNYTSSVRLYRYWWCGAEKAGCPAHLQQLLSTTGGGVALLHTHTYMLNKIQEESNRREGKGRCCCLGDVLKCRNSQGWHGIMSIPYPKQQRRPLPSLLPDSYEIIKTVCKEKQQQIIDDFFY